MREGWSWCACVLAGVEHPLVLLPVSPLFGLLHACDGKQPIGTYLCVPTLFGAWDPQWVWTVGGRVFNFFKNLPSFVKGWRKGRVNISGVGPWQGEGGVHCHVSFLYFLLGMGGYSYCPVSGLSLLEFEGPKLASTPAHAHSSSLPFLPLPFICQFSEIKIFCLFFNLRFCNWFL